MLLLYTGCCCILLLIRMQRACALFDHFSSHIVVISWCGLYFQELQERVRVERLVGERRHLPVRRRGVRAQGL
jgi:hypothetical protein